MPTKYKGKIHEIKTLNAFINLMRAADSIDSRLSAKLKDYNLTTSQFGILEALYHLGPMSQKELGNKILKSGGNITKVIDNLEKKNLLIRQSKTSDRRANNVILTSEGMDLIKSVFPRHLKYIVREFSVLNDDELDTLRKLARYLGKQKRE